MTTVADRMVVSAVVKKRGEKADGWEFELDIPSFRSDYPIIIDRVPDAVAGQFPPREEFYSLVLLRKALRKQKGGEPYSGRLPWHYYWGLEGLATPQEQAAQAQAPDPQEEREKRIMRATALTQAVAYHSGVLQGAGVGKVLEVAGEFYAWLRDGQTARQEAQDEASPPAMPVGLPVAAETPVAQEAPGPSEPVGTEDRVWMVRPEEVEQRITPDDWARLGQMLEEQKVPKQAFSQWLRSKWGLKYVEKARRGDLREMVSWLREQGNTQAKG